MKITINEVEHELTFTFNSFRYLENFEIGELANITARPFKVLSVTQSLLLGALNADPRVKVSPQETQDYIASVIESEDGDIFELLTILMDELEKTNFFKQLQKSAKPQKKTAKK